ncbi:GH25 family lysozyme [Streptomyces sp. NPDC046939]|uniref:GH25 family lysozyme n=1 Tax=Streptomyces sp. NPDC046939 TaxID=3155376 RepID=UPI0033C37373
MLHGLDISAYQPPSYATDDQSFVFIKATEGRTYTNPHIEAQTRTGRRAGLVVGYYHFLWPGRIRAQARHFLSKIPEKPGDVLAVDWEATGNGSHASSAEKDRFIRRLKAQRPHHRVVLYTNRDFWLNADTASYAGDGLWIADYVSAGEPRIRADWLFHQYTSHPHDKNVAQFPDRDALRQWADGA